MYAADFDLLHSWREMPVCSSNVRVGQFPVPRTLPAKQRSSLCTALLRGAGESGGGALSLLPLGGGGDDPSLPHLPPKETLEVGEGTMPPPLIPPEGGGASVVPPSCGGGVGPSYLLFLLRGWGSACLRTLAIASASCCPRLKALAVDYCQHWQLPIHWAVAHPLGSCPPSPALTVASAGLGCTRQQRSGSRCPGTNIPGGWAVLISPLSLTLPG